MTRIYSGYAIDSRALGLSMDHFSHELLLYIILSSLFGARYVDGSRSFIGRRLMLFFLWSWRWCDRQRPPFRAHGICLTDGPPSSASPGPPRSCSHSPSIARSPAPVLFTLRRSPLLILAHRITSRASGVVSVTSRAMPCAFSSYPSRISVHFGLAFAPTLDSWSFLRESMPRVGLTTAEGTIRTICERPNTLHSAKLFVVSVIGNTLYATLGLVLGQWPELLHNLSPYAALANLERLDCASLTSFLSQYQQPVPDFRDRLSKACYLTSA
jgi:hypothetical protein